KHIIISLVVSIRIPCIHIFPCQQNSINCFMLLWKKRMLIAIIYLNSFSGTSIFTQTFVTFASFA
ncbi:hypothetical protein KY308_03795, partial [Candidatus Woesearchaeota archaeon]|nr:hypothetical protein [Candidatus Woesearchaeota archaeon]